MTTTRRDGNARLCIVRLDSFDGRDTHLHCGNDEQDYLYCVVQVGVDGRGEIVDNGYRSFEEAASAWPETTSHRELGPGIPRKP